MRLLYSLYLNNLKASHLLLVEGEPLRLPLRRVVYCSGYKTRGWVLFNKHKVNLIAHSHGMNNSAPNIE